MLFRSLEAGQELGRFFLGSTVVLVTEAGDLAWSDEAGDTVKVRAALAQTPARAESD